MNPLARDANSGQNLQVVVERVFSAPRERVFRAWTDPALMEKWFAPPPMQPVGVEADVTVGGRFRIGMRQPDGHVHYAAGKYVEILPSERLVFTWAWETDPPQADSLVTVEFFKEGDSTRVVLKHEQLPLVPSPEEHRRGWEGCLEHLEVNLELGLV